MNEILKTEFKGILIDVDLNYCPYEHKIWINGVTVQGIDITSLFDCHKLEEHCLLEIEKIHEKQNEERYYDSIGD